MVTSRRGGRGSAVRLWVVALGWLAAAWVAAATPEGLSLAANASPEEMAKAYGTALAGLLPGLAANDMAVVNHVETLTHYAARPGADAERTAWSQAMCEVVLRADSATTVRLWLLKRLTYMGGAEAVAAESARLGDTDALVREAARRALQHNPAGEAGEALWTAATATADAPWRAALVEAAGGRADVGGFVPRLAGLVTGDADAAVVKAALFALGNAGTPEAGTALRDACGRATPAWREPALDACVRCADRLLRNGRSEEAASVFETVWNHAAAGALKPAALRGLVLARGRQALPLVEPLLTGDDAAWRAMAIGFLDERPGTDGTAVLVSLLPRLAPVGQALVLVRLGARGDATARPAVLASADSPEAGVRAAAFGALASLGTAEDVPLLLKAATAGGKGEDTAVAHTALVRLRAGGTVAAITAGLPNAAPEVRVELLRVLAERPAPEAVAAVLPCVADGEPAVRAEALRTLGEIGDDAALPALLDALAAPNADVAAAGAAVQAVCRRTPRREACVTAVVPRLLGALAPVRGALLQALACLGGEPALQAVRAALADADAGVRQAAIKSLSAWPDLAAAPDLLGAAKSDTAPANRVLALRGYVNLAGTLAGRGAPRVEMCRSALAVVERPDEKRLVLGMLAGLKSADALRLVVPLLDDAAVAAEARQAATTLAKDLGKAVPDDLKPALAGLGTKPDGK